MNEKSLRIYKTIKANRALLKDTRIILTDRQKKRIETDNMILLNELNKIKNREMRKNGV